MIFQKNIFLKLGLRDVFDKYKYLVAIKESDYTRCCIEHSVSNYTVKLRAEGGDIK